MQMTQQQKQKKGGFTITEILIVVVLLFGIAIPCLYGYVNNIVKFTKCDFKEPYKAEILRGIGIAIAPVGMVEGYLTIDDGQVLGK